jgi:serine/threonine protein kinase
MNIREGDVLAGKYRVERVLGLGGMGMVVAARHIILNERVAMKFLLPEMLGEPEALGRFLREARSAARIKNEHVVRVSDVGELDDGVPYIVMEYLEGKDLAAVLRERGPLPIEETVDYLVQTCEAIAGAHALGIVHRDLKPSNLMLVTRSDGMPFIKVFDFGISKVASKDASMAMTRTAAVLGSPLYMSPEQLTSARDVDARADIWSLGTILYELLTGSPPFMAQSLPGLAVLIATTPHRPMANLRAGIPAELDAVVSNCLAKQRDERYASVAELAAALAPFASEQAAISIRSSARILGASDRPKAAPASNRPAGTGPLSTAPVVRSSRGLNDVKDAETVTKVRDGQPKKSGRAMRYSLVVGVVIAIAVLLGVLAFSKRRHTEAVVDRSETTPQTAAAPSSISPPASPESPTLDDRAIATAASVDNTHAPAIAPTAPTEPKPKSAAPTKPAKPATATKQAPPRTPPATKPPAKQPESAYEHM